MRSNKGMRIGLILITIALLGFPQFWNVAHSVAAPLEQDNVHDVTYPPEGSVLSGIVSIQGTATHTNFVSYGLLYATGSTVSGDTGWRLDTPIAWDVQSMVVNGELGQWDTTLLPNGQYVLALVVYEAGNDTPYVDFVNNLTIQNEDTTPTPEPTTEPLPGEEGVDPTSPEATVESAAPVAPTIEQPATATPRPTATLGPQLTPTPDEEGGINPADILSGAAIKEAFITGAWLAFFFYIIGGFYVLFKAVIRYYMRQMHRKQNQHQP